MKLNVFLAGLCVLFYSSCTDNNHLITSEHERENIQQDFNSRREALAQENLFEIFDRPMDAIRHEAMTFLYAYMPLADIADHSGEYFLENVEYSLKAKAEMSWGKVVPEREFRHFVLPLRVNNENLDDCRKVFYEDLKDRVKGLSMYDAVLEVNHWCHEKVTYTPSDSRTSSPLASVKTAYGRCGEESTFTVAALRAVGIPARQVYTPRWAHTDDNHAWVEAWVDGKWYFLGACEPMPVLNLGWFNAPASRGMLMHTKVFGRYTGPEEVMRRTPRYTEINVIDNYAPTAKIDVLVVDIDGKAVSDAKVEYKVYNYGEFYSVATKRSDVDGKSQLSAGKGDMIVWASKNGKYGFEKVSFGKDSDVTICLNKSAGDAYSLDYDITPPDEGANIPEVSAEQQAENDRRFAQEDSIRNAYIATFMNSKSATEFAKSNKLDAEVVAPILVASRGNYATLCDFLSALPLDMRSEGVDLLQQISSKDLRDVSLDVLYDHINTPRGIDGKNFSKYVRNPRVSDEMIVPYKAFFNAEISDELRQSFQADPMKLVAWVADSIRIDNDCNIGGAPITPPGVWKSRMADVHSRDIFFASAARSMGIPARIDEITGKVQLLNGSKVIDVNFESVEQKNVPTGRLLAKFTPTKSQTNPKYYYHFSISKITPEGDLQLLNYEDGDSWESLLKNGAELDAGDYAMVSGTRLAKGGVLSHVEVFSIAEGKTTEVELLMRENKDEVQVIGSFNSESLYKNIVLGKDVSVLTTTGRGYYAVAVVGVGQEPTNHALRDIAAMSDELEKWGRKIIVLFPNEEQFKKFIPEEFPGLPSTIEYGIDNDGSIQKQIVENMKFGNSSVLPLVIIGDTFNRVVFASQGYTIGLGEQMTKVIRKL